MNPNQGYPGQQMRKSPSMNSPNGVPMQMSPYSVQSPNIQGVQNMQQMSPIMGAQQRSANPQAPPNNMMPMISPQGQRSGLPTPLMQNIQTIAGQPPIPNQMGGNPNLRDIQGLSNMQNLQNIPNMQLQTNMQNMQNMQNRQMPGMPMYQGIPPPNYPANMNMRNVQNMPGMANLQNMQQMQQMAGRQMSPQGAGMMPQDDLDDSSKQPVEEIPYPAQTAFADLHITQGFYKYLISAGRQISFSFVQDKTCIVIAEAMNVYMTGIVKRAIWHSKQRRGLLQPATHQTQIVSIPKLQFCILTAEREASAHPMGLKEFTNNNNGIQENKNAKDQSTWLPKLANQARTGIEAILPEEGERANMNGPPESQAFNPQDPSLDPPTLEQISSEVPETRHKPGITKIDIYHSILESPVPFLRQKKIFLIDKITSCSPE